MDSYYKNQKNEIAIIQIENLSKNINEDVIIEIFRKTFQISIKDLKCIENDNTKTFQVSIEDPIKASLAISTLNNMMLQDNKLSASWISTDCENSGSTIYVGNLDEMVNEKELQKLFSRFGSIKNIKIFKNTQSLKNKNYAFIRYLNSEDSSSAIFNLNGVPICNTKITVNHAFIGNNSLNCSISKNNQTKPIANENKSISTIYIGNINTETTENRLREYFQIFGKIDSINLHKGYAFIKFDSNQNGMKAIKDTDGIVFNGSKIKVSWANQNKTTNKNNDYKSTIKDTVESNFQLTDKNSAPSLISNQIKSTENHDNIFPNLFDLNKIVDQYNDSAVSDFYTVKGIW